MEQFCSFCSTIVIKPKVCLIVLVKIASVDLPCHGSKLGHKQKTLYVLKSQDNYQQNILIEHFGIFHA